MLGRRARDLQSIADLGPTVGKSTPIGLQKWHYEVAVPKIFGFAPTKTGRALFVEKADGMPLLDSQSGDGRMSIIRDIEWLRVRPEVKMVGLAGYFDFIDRMLARWTMKDHKPDSVFVRFSKLEPFKHTKVNMLVVDPGELNPALDGTAIQWGRLLKNPGIEDDLKELGTRMFTRSSPSGMEEGQRTLIPEPVHETLNELTKFSRPQEVTDHLFTIAQKIPARELDNLWIKQLEVADALEKRLRG